MTTGCDPGDEEQEKSLQFKGFATFCKKISKRGFTNPGSCDIIYLADEANGHRKHGALAQLVAHNTGSVGVRSSSLLCSTR